MAGAPQDQIDSPIHRLDAFENSAAAASEDRPLPAAHRPRLPSAHPERSRRWRRGKRRTRRVSTGLALAQFAVAGVVAFIVLAAIGVTTLRKAAVSQAISQAATRAVANANQHFAPAVTDALASGDRAAVGVANRIAQEQLLSDRVVRVKVWTQQGRIVYSDEPRLINEVYPLDAADLAVLQFGKPDAGLSDLKAPENVYEHSFGRLLQVYARVKTASGRPMLLELYLRFDSVTASANALLRAVAPAFLLALLALEILQVPLAWRLVRRIGAGHRERQALSRRALEASDHERRRIARDLHDGVVQSLAGVSYALAAVGTELGRTESAHLAGVVETAARSTRQNIAELRSLIFDINPPSLQRLGLVAAVHELTASLTEAGVVVRTDAPAFVSLSEERAAALYRAAQEAVRNVLSHSQASSVQLTLELEPGLVVLTVTDDGIGFDVAAGSADAAGAHFGLGLIEDMATDWGGRMQVRSAVGAGTTIRFELPPT